MKYATEFKHFSDHDNIDDLNTKPHAFIAIHNTNLGPATGGTRFFSYKSESAAISYDKKILYPMLEDNESINNTANVLTKK
ncbi:MAG: hypothetical protein QGG63_00035 [Candidatus Pacebacteria bacterium]|jgi:glutamate dehydrogenase/leucine dehydrogenase|nr:hypothetical protein [Candidatus Paceibacterota bacterium]|tara:strand:+ start:74482 stop:74724 length:243 start_codon:yes stop_codon:yes gene_type:complete